MIGLSTGKARGDGAPGPCIPSCGPPGWRVDQACRSVRASKLCEIQGVRGETETGECLPRLLGTSMGDESAWGSGKACRPINTRAAGHAASANIQRHVSAPASGISGSAIKVDVSAPKDPGQVDQRTRERAASRPGGNVGDVGGRGGHVHADPDADQKPCDEQLRHRGDDRRSDREDDEKSRLATKIARRPSRSDKSPKISMPSMAPRKLAAPSRPIRGGVRWNCGRRKISAAPITSRS